MNSRIQSLHPVFQEIISSNGTNCPGNIQLLSITKRKAVRRKEIFSPKQLASILEREAQPLIVALFSRSPMTQSSVTSWRRFARDCFSGRGVTPEAQAIFNDGCEFLKAEHGKCLIEFQVLR